MHLLKDHFALDNDNKESESSERKKKKKKRDHESVLDSQTAESTTLASTSAISSDSEISSYLTNNSINIDYGTKEVPNELKPILQFPSLFSRIPSQLHAALSKFNEPTPIQACSWPALLAGRDVVGIAETGRYVLPPLIDYTLLLICSSILKWKDACFWNTRPGWSLQIKIIQKTEESICTRTRSHQRVSYSDTRDFFTIGGTAWSQKCGTLRWSR